MAEMEPKKSNIVALTWVHSSVDTGQTGSAMRLVTSGGHVVDTLVMPFNGSIVGISGRLEDVVGTGSLTVKPIINTTTSAASIYWRQSTTSHTREVYAGYSRGDYPFSAGDYLRVQYTAGGTFMASASTALTVTLWCHLEQN